MFLVFIQYGDNEGRQIGIKFKRYLDSKGINSFLAGPESPDIIPGTEHFEEFIDGKILESNVMVSIVTNGYDASEGVARELSFRDNNNPQLQIIPCVRYEVCYPEKLRKYHHWILKFDPHYVERYFPDWLIECFRHLNISIAKQPDKVDEIIDVTAIVKNYVGGV